MVSTQNKITTALTAALIAAAFTTFSAQAQEYTVVTEQPALLNLHAKEAQLEVGLTNAYRLGMIDSLQLANMRRDLDAIRVKEESYCMRGMTSGGYDRIADRLTLFENNLNAHCADSGNVIITTPVIEYR